MKLLSRIAAVILFILFFGFALENTQEVVLHFFLDYEIRGPLVLILLGFFAVGAVLAVLAMTPIVFRHRRDLSKHEKTILRMQQEQEAKQAARSKPPQTDDVLIK
ncbi:MAG: LapA family protein [Burkholderiaceae bacterium]|nr:LapA family protein [Burkholderiaceae bacterium]